MSTHTGIFDDPRLTAMGLLAETFTGMQAKILPALSEAGLSATDFDVLLRLARSPGERLRMTDLATQAALSTSGVTRVVDRLESRVLVCRQTCASDRRGAFAVVEAAFLELAEPDVDAGAADCVAQGAERVVLLPYFLSAGVHVRRDLSEAQARLAERFPAVEFRLAEPLGRHPLLLDVVASLLSAGEHPKAVTRVTTRRAMSFISGLLSAA